MPSWYIKNEDRTMLSLYPKENSKCAGYKFRDSVTQMNSDLVNDVFWPLIIILKILGQSPLSYMTLSGDPDTTMGGGVSTSSSSDTSASSGRWGFVRSSNFQERGVKGYGINPKSLFFLWTSLAGSFFALSLGIMTIEAISDDARYFNLGLSSNRQKLLDYTVSKGKFEEQVIGKETPTMRSLRMAIDLILVIIPLNYLLELIFCWTETKSFAKFLNTFSALQLEFLSIFPGQQWNYNGLRRKRNFLLVFYVFIPSVTLTSFQMMGIFKNDFSFGDLMKLAPFSAHSLLMTLIEDVKVILTYKTLSSAFSQLKIGIVESTKREELTIEKIKDWRGLIHKIRIEAQFVGESQKAHQLALLGFSLVLLTGSIFFLLHVPGVVSWNWTVGIGGIAFCFVTVWRIYIKIIAANEITRNEYLIGRELMEIDMLNKKSSVQMEINFMHDLITQNPTSINFGNYVIFNKKFLLRLCGQVVTYLIVLMQFSQSQHAN